MEPSTRRLELNVLMTEALEKDDEVAIQEIAQENHQLLQGAGEDVEWLSPLDEIPVKEKE